MKKFKLMLIDDNFNDRKDAYFNIFSSEKFEITPIESYAEFKQKVQNIPVDGYIVDAFLDTKDWSDIGTADVLFLKHLTSPPRKAPVFLVSQKWGDPKATEILTKVNQQKNIEVLRYIAFEEFDNAPKVKENEKVPYSVEVLRSKIIDDLSIWHELSLFSRDENKPIRILLLADLQYSDPHTAETAVFDEKWIGKALKAKKLIPDFIIFAGDISFTGAPDEFRLAKEKIEGLAKYMWNKQTLGVERERILLVPGNHDVNLRIAACDQYKWDRDEKKWVDNEKKPLKENKPAASDDTIYSTYRNFALEPFRQFSRSLTGSRMWNDAECLCKVDRRFEHLGIRFFLFNSVNDLNIDEPQKARFNDNALDKIISELGVDDETDSVFSMAISHHGISKSVKQVQMENWDTVGEQYFHELQIKLWMFGHYHKHSSYTINEDPFDEENLGIIQAATLKIRSEAPRGFSLIELGRKSGSVSTVKEYVFKLDGSGCELKSSEPKVLFTVPELNSSED